MPRQAYPIVFQIQQAHQRQAKARTLRVAWPAIRRLHIWRAQTLPLIAGYLAALYGLDVARDTVCKVYHQ